MKPEEVIERLLSSVWIVLFREVTTKKIREMKCTLSHEYVSRENQRKSIKKKDLLPVWDIDNKGWRSFYFDTVIEMVPFVEEN
tara:strand:- start:90 stop:338 length:249 start_codon:yes stop_codon:yes gene_type:complete